MTLMKFRDLKLAVFCSERDIGDEFLQLAYELGKAIAISGATLIYGGRLLGLMGAIYRGAAENEGQIIGVLPSFLADSNSCIGVSDTETIITTDIHTRKSWMEAHADAFICLPGGVGTLDELITVLETKLCGQHDKPIILLDPSDHYSYLILFLRYLMSHNLTSLSDRTFLILVKSPQQAIETIYHLMQHLHK